MCEGLISGCAAFNAKDAKCIATRANASLFISYLPNGGYPPQHANLGELDNSQPSSKDSQLIYCRVLWETTNGFITPLPISCDSVSVCELGVMSVQISCIFVRSPLIASSYRVVFTCHHHPSVRLVGRYELQSE